VLEHSNGLRSRLPSVSVKLHLFARLLRVALAAFGILLEDIVGRLRSRLSHARHESHSAIADSVADFAQPGDQPWATAGNNSRHYLETSLLSPTRFLFVYDDVFVDTRLDSGTDKPRGCGPIWTSTLRASSSSATARRGSVIRR